MKIDNGYASHQPILEYVLSINKKPILELGSGDFSTKLIHEKNNMLKIITIDNNLDWLNKFIYLKNDYHDFKHIPINNIVDFYNNDNEEWGLVFIDYGSWDGRVSAINKYKNISDYVILHDCDYFPHNSIFGNETQSIDFNNKNFGHRDYSDIFKYWIEFFMEDWADIREYPMPPTLLGSNKFPLNDVYIEGMIICNRNK